MLKKLLAFLEARDEKSIASCFSEDCKLYDYCPCVNGDDAFIIYGRKGVEMLYRSIFAINKLYVAEAEYESELTGTYFGAYNGPYVFSRISVELDNDGLIKRAIVVPA